MDIKRMRPDSYEYTLEFANGLKFEHLKMNGTGYIIGKELDESIFTEDALKSLKITNESTGLEELITDVIYCGSFIHPNDGMYHVNFAPKPANVKMREQFAQVSEVASNSEADITDIQEALAEVYEMMVEITSVMKEE